MAPIDTDTLTCDFCEQEVDRHGYEYRFIRWNDLCLCSKCEEQGRHV